MVWIYLEKNCVVNVYGFFYFFLEELSGEYMIELENIKFLVYRLFIILYLEEI